jgi:hypothetical protein
MSDNYLPASENMLRCSFAPFPKPAYFAPEQKPERKTGNQDGKIFTP